jgi:sugar phosphate isomerase/epimerase
MKLSISNIAWEMDFDDEMYAFLKYHGFQGLEIAPTRIFPDNPYDHLTEAEEWAFHLKEKYNLIISSMQSIWYGRDEKIFESKKERKLLIEYTKKAILFAEAIKCKNLVFGNPKNRDTDDFQRKLPIAIHFFKEVGDYAHEHHTVLALEPNPPVYNTRVMNRTEQTVDMAHKISSKGIKVNIDLGAILYNEENLDYLEKIPELINHIHISEPGLKKIKKRKNIHTWILKFSQKNLNNSFVSIEMGRQKVEDVKETIVYLKNLI